VVWVCARRPRSLPGSLALLQGLPDPPDGTISMTLQRPGPASAEPEDLPHEPADEYAEESAGEAADGEEEKEKATLARSSRTAEERKALARAWARAKAARTDYSTLDTAEEVSFVALFPRTGRMHQLRLHCARALGCPVLGDLRYSRPRETLAALQVPCHPTYTHTAQHTTSLLTTMHRVAHMKPHCTA
jgi:hypothetical protein